MHRCEICGAKNPQRHHIIPRYLGGSNGPIAYLCWNCHMKLHKMAEEMIRNHKKACGECDTECKRTYYIKAYELMKLERDMDILL